MFHEDMFCADMFYSVELYVPDLKMGEKAEPTGIKYPPSEFSQKYSRSNFLVYF